MNEITINWHIIQKCNYTCTYCFAKYEKYETKEIHQSKEKIEILLNNIYSYFNKKYDGYTIRLNLAGGEPSLSRNFDFIIKKAYKIGFKVSIITNSSKLTTKFIESNAKYIFIHNKPKAVLVDIKWFEHANKKHFDENWVECVLPDPWEIKATKEYEETKANWKLETVDAFKFLDSLNNKK